jgi:hypothetical protein
MKRIGILLFFIGSIITSGSLSLSGQFFKIYGYQTVEANAKELVYWYSVIPSSDISYDYFGVEVDRNWLMAHSLEIEYGISNKYTVALYADFEHPKGEQIKYTRAKAVAMYYRFFEKNERPVDIAIYAEYILPRKGYQTSEEIELKLILEKDIKFHQVILNPTFEKKISGLDVTEGIEFVFNGGYYYRGSLIFQPGLEFYMKMGELYDLSPFQEQNNYIFPAFDLFLGKKRQFHWHAGVGFGLTDPADNLVVKSILSWEFF